MCELQELRIHNLYADTIFFSQHVFFRLDKKRAPSRLGRTMHGSMKVPTENRTFKDAYGIDKKSS